MYRELLQFGSFTLLRNAKWIKSTLWIQVLELSLISSLCGKASSSYSNRLHWQQTPHQEIKTLC
jgi:hypothetical protein